MTPRRWIYLLSSAALGMFALALHEVDAARPRFFLVGSGLCVVALAVYAGRRVGGGNPPLISAMAYPESLLRAALESTADGILVVGTDGMMKACNRRFGEMWRIPSALLAVGNDARMLEHAKSQLRDPDAFLRRVQQLYGRDEVAQHDIIEMADGRVFERYSQPQVLDGLVVGRVWSFRDVSERERRAQELRDSQWDLTCEVEITRGLSAIGHELIEALAAPDLLPRLCATVVRVLECDSSVTFLATEADARLVAMASSGVHPEAWEAIQAAALPAVGVAGHGSSDVAVFDPSIGPPLVHLLRRFQSQQVMLMPLLQGDRVVGFQSAAFHSPGRQFSEANRRLANGVAHIASLALEHVRVSRQLEAANALKSEFVATMSHELRTPINVILGYVDLVRDGEFGAVSPDQDDVLLSARRSALTLLELVNATLDLSRLESGRVRLDLRDVDLDDLFREIDAETADLRLSSGLEFHWPLPGTLGAFRTDPLKFKVILKNLIGNAVKFTEHGTVALSATHADDHLLLRVTDTGIGIAPEALARVFDPFEQGDSVPARGTSGVGLGLFIVRRLVDLLGGRILVDSQPGAGTQFSITLPRR